MPERNYLLQQHPASVLVAGADIDNEAFMTPPDEGSTFFGPFNAVFRVQGRRRGCGYQATLRQ